VTGSLLSRVLVYDDAVPEAWTDPLVALVTSHPRKGTYWQQRSMIANTFVDQVVNRLAEVKSVDTSWTGTEVWWRVQGADTGFHFHFDRDESIRDHVRSPLVSSILYLSDVGGATIIVDAEANRIRPPTQAVAITPRARRFVTFPGSLFHGVMPAEANPEPRAAVFLNWWTERPLATSNLEANMSPSTVAALPISQPSTPTVPVAFDASELFDESTWRKMLLIAQIDPRTLHLPNA
jgi:hypothetical protein